MPSGLHVWMQTSRGYQPNQDTKIACTTMLNPVEARQRPSATARLFPDEAVSSYDHVQS